MRFIAKYYVTLSLAVAQLAVSAWLYFGVIRPMQLETAALNARAAALDAEISVRRKNSDARVQWWVQRMIADSVYADSVEVRLSVLEKLMLHKPKPKPSEEELRPKGASFFDLFFQPEISKMTDMEKILLGAISTLATVIVAMAMFIKSTLKYIADDKDGREENDRKDRAETLAVISNNSRVIEGFKEFLQRFKQ